MITEIIKVNPHTIDLSKIKKAAKVIKNGGLVAFPTETVYGLGADALNPHAVAKIFGAKNRPLDDPLIIHISEKEDLFKLANEIPEIALKLSNEFWPGPLTLILTKSNNIPDIVTAGLSTVALRMPANDIALNLIKESGTFIAAPSANLFGRPSPVMAQHVVEDLDGRIDIIIDGGKTEVGIESTVLDLTHSPFSILRPGGISIERFREIVEVEMHKENKRFKKNLSPGMHLRHYSPKAQMMLVQGNGKDQVEKVKSLASRFNGQNRRIGIVAIKENKDAYDRYNVKLLGQGDDLTACAANLFSVLRDFDKEGVDVIIVESVQEKGIGAAIMDRLRKAASVIV